MADETIRSISEKGAKYILSLIKKVEVKASEKVDKVSGKGLSTNDYTDTAKKKLEGIAEGANKYTHPSTHSASMIEQDSTHRFVTDTEKSSWDGTYEQSTAYTDQAIADLIDGAPTTLDTLKEVADAIAENESVVEALDAAVGKKANQTELDTHTGNSTVHITASERTKWNKALAATGDSTNNTVTFTSGDSTSPTAWSDVAVLTSGEKHRTILNKISTMFKNIRYLYTMLGTTDISAIGDGTATGAISELNTNLDNALKVHVFSIQFGGLQANNETQFTFSLSAFFDRTIVCTIPYIHLNGYAPFSIKIRSISKEEAIVSVWNHASVTTTTGIVYLSVFYN